MILKDAIAQADMICTGNAYSNEQKTKWLEELDNRIQSEIWHWGPDNMVEYTWDDEGDNDSLLLVDPPHDRMYQYWLAAQICLADGEREFYALYFSEFDFEYKKYWRWFNANKIPSKEGRFYIDLPRFSV